MKHFYLIILALLFSFLAKSQINLDEGLVGHYSFNGNTNDISSNGYHATNYGGTFIGDGSVNDNQAIKFNGIDQYTEIENKEAFANSTYSISAYVNGRNLEDPATIFSTFYYKDYGNYWGYIFRIKDKKFQIANLHNSAWGVDESIYSNTSLQANEYYHVVITYDGEYAKIYINSELDATGQLPQPEFNTSIKNAHIGTNHTANDALGRFFNGVIDELKIYDRALNQSEINQLYSECESIVDLEDGLTAYYPFNENANNESGNAHNGAVTGAILTSDRLGRTDNAYLFDGIDDYINCGHDPIDTIESTSFSLWIYPENNDGTGNTNSQNNEYIISSGGQTSASAGYSMFWNNGYLKLVKKTATSKAVIDLIGPFPKNEWLHIVGLFDSSNETFKVYIQGVLFTEVTSTAFETVDFDYRELHIGKPNNVDNYYFNGLIDNIRLYNRVLSEKEIESLYYETCRADFKASSTIDDITAPIQFSDISKSENTISNWQWDFDNDGIIDSEEQNPEYTYETAGNYDVKLVISDGTYVDSIVKHNYIKIFDIDEGLLRHYNLDDNLEDTSGNNMDASATDTIFTFKNGISNSCYKTDYMSRIDAPAIGNWGDQLAISFWFYGNASDGAQALLGSRQSGSGATLTNLGCILQTDSILRFFIASDAPDEPNTYSSNKIKPYDWNHVVLIQNREINKNIIILNGVADSVTYTQTPRYKNYPIGFGGWNSDFNSTRGFIGRIDDIRIYNRELSLEEVNSLLNEEFDMDTDNEIFAEYEFIGNANDISGNGYNGIVQGPELTYDRFENAGNAYYFNASETDYIDLGTDLQAENFPFFVSAWINQDDVSGEQVIFRNDDWDTTSVLSGVIVKSIDGKISAAYGNAAGNTEVDYYEKTTTETILEANMWYHVVVGFLDPDNIAIFINNEETPGTYSGTITELGYQNKNGAFGIGSNETSKFNGTIDDVRLYNRYVDAMEISYLYSITDPYSPEFNISLTELNFNDVNIGETSDEQTCILTGNYLDGPVKITAPNGFEVSISSGENFDTLLTIYPDYAKLNDTAVYVRFKPSEDKSYTGSITLNTLNVPEKTITVSGSGLITSIYDYNATEYDLKIYPNPAQDYVYINVSDNTNGLSFIVVNMLGQTLNQDKINESKKQIDVSTFSPGIYFISIINEQRRVVKSVKMIKK